MTIKRDVRFDFALIIPKSGLGKDGLGLDRATPISDKTAIVLYQHASFDFFCSCVLVNGVTWGGLSDQDVHDLTNLLQAGPLEPLVTQRPSIAPESVGEMVTPE